MAGLSSSHSTIKRAALAALVFIGGIAAITLPVHSQNAPARTGSQTITFIHFNDLHAHLTPHADLAPAAPSGQTSTKTKIVERGGLARTATLIKRIRAGNPNTILMNIGDTYHGGVEALFTNGNAIVAPVNALGIDVGVPGNWDFAYGPEVTRARYGDNPSAMRMASRMMAGEIERPNFPNLAANVTYTLPARRGQPFLPPTLMKEISGVKVGFIGITSDIVPRMHPMLAMGFAFLEGEDNYRNLINQRAQELRNQGALIVVVMSELGIHKDYRLAQIIEPGVDVIFSAHTHEATFTPLASKSGALVVEAGNDGYLGRMDISVSEGKVVRRKWQLLPIGKDIPEDAQIKALVDAARAPFLAADVNLALPNPMISHRLTRSITTVVGRTEIALDRRTALESSFNNLFTDMLRAKGGTQIAMTPGFRFDSVIGASGAPLEDNTVATGEITLEDAYRFFPVPFTIATARISGQRLREIMEQGLTSVFSTDAFKQGGGWMEGFSGLQVRLDLSKPDGERITEIRLKGNKQPISSDSSLSVTGCSRPLEASDVLCGYSGFSQVQPLINPATGKPWMPIDLFVAALAQGAGPGARRDLTDLNQTAIWPQTPYVQPLMGVETVTSSERKVANEKTAAPRPVTRQEGKKIGEPKKPM